MPVVPTLSAPACHNQPAAGAWCKAVVLCMGIATTVLAGCAGGYSGGNNPALGQGGGGSMGIAGSSGNGVQMYGTADVSYGSSHTVTRSGASSRTGL